MPLTDSLLLFIAALLAGAVNSVAGGGTFIAFPALLLTGMPGIIANATCAVAVWPGSVASAFAYREELKQESRTSLRKLIVIAAIGSSIGAWLLLQTPEQVFSDMVPYLLLVAATVFTFGKKATVWLRAFGHARVQPPMLLMLGLLLQLGISIYGGYFGAGFGIVTLAILQLMGHDHIHRMNAVKAVLASVVNAVTLVIFAAAAIVAWPQALWMTVAATLGGYYGAAIARRSSPQTVRGFVIGVAWAMTAYFFWKQ